MSSFGDLERVVCLEGVLEYEFNLDLSLFILDLILQLCNFAHCANILRVNLSLKQVKIIDLICWVSSLTLLFCCHLGLSQVNTLQAGARSFFIFIDFFLFLQGFLLVEDFRLLLALSAIFQILKRHLTEVFSTEHINSLIIAQGCTRRSELSLFCIFIKHKLGSAFSLTIITVAFIDSTH